MSSAALLDAGFGEATVDVHGDADTMAAIAESLAARGQGEHAASLDVVQADLDRRLARQNRSARGPRGQVLWAQRDAVKAVASDHGLTNIRVFGSVARGEDRPDSDVDLLVDLPAGMGLFGFGRAASELEDLLGIPVDLVPARSLKPRVRPEIEAQAVPL